MTALTFILGLSVGSFLNVLIDRLPKGETVVGGRSYCDCCRHKLSWYDLVPLFSFILLKRKCRYCGASISWQYPIVELTTGLMFVYAYFYLNSTTMIYIIEAEIYYFTLVYYLIVISGLIVIFFTDLKYRIIPDKVILFLTITSLLFLFFLPQSLSIIHYPLSITHQSLFINHLSSGIFMLLFFFFLVLLTRGKGMGLGDVKFSFLMGLVLGFPKILIAFYLSFLTGAIFSLILMLLGRKTMKSTIPFGPFLVVSTLVSLFYGFDIWNLFMRILEI